MKRPYLTKILLTAAVAAASSVSSFAHSTPGNEIVVIIDNSGSMAAPFHDSKGKAYPASDPDRIGTLGTLAIMGVSMGSSDRVTVIAFGDKEDGPARIVEPTQVSPGISPEDEIRALPYVNDTFFRKALERARQLFDKSDRDGKLLVFLSDGAPTDIRDPQESPKILGLSDGRFDTMVLGLFGSPESQQHGQSFLRPITRTADDLIFLRSPSELIGGFTGAYARVLGSKPFTGRLSPGQSKSYDVGKHVVEVLAITASSDPGPAYTASLVGPKGAAPILSQGDNGCKFKFSNAPKLCEEPRRHYQVFRQSNDPDRSSKWTLSLKQGSSDIDYGLILRYDILASLAVGPVVNAAEANMVEARLLFRGKTFVDEDFFRSDGFEASATVDGQNVSLKYAGDGRFVGSWVPPISLGGETATVRASFRNTWLQRSADRSVLVEAGGDLILRPNPNPLLIGHWRGDISSSKHCAQVDLTGSTNAEYVELLCALKEVPADFQASFVPGATCQAVPGSEAVLPSGKRGQPLRWEVCVTAPRCCGDISSAANMKPMQLVLYGKAPRFASKSATVPILFEITRTGFLRCYWPFMAFFGGVAAFLWLILGFIRPNNFNTASSVRVAASEAGLKRCSALVLRELPGGIRGFYRNARIAINATGDFVKSAKAAVLVLEAGRASTTVLRCASKLEKKSRNGKWEDVSALDLTQGPILGAVYRIGNLYMRFE